MSNNPFEERQRRRTSRRGVASGEPPIWVARHVEWPIPSVLSFANFNRLLKASKTSAQQLGIDPDAEKEESETGASESYFSGLMSRVLNAQQGTEKTDESEDTAGTGIAIRAPRSGCVAAANGWIVAALECATGQNTLRLMSRWNVRRGGLADQWVALPPAVDGNGRIAHVFVDPTASHVLISGANGEAYYCHTSTQRHVVKLAGFGRNADGTTRATSGIPATAVAFRSTDPAAQLTIQVGLSGLSYVTAVAWDKDRGTEGSSKRILLGTSAGEIYEYSLIAPGSQDQEEAVPAPILLHKLYASDAADPSELGAVVTGLYFERLRTGLLVLAATSGRNKRTRFYTFYSAHNSSFRMVMADQQHASFVELPGSMDFADLRLVGDNFGLRTATGIYYGSIDRSLAGPSILSGSSSMIIDSGILPYDKGVVPVCLALTPHHMITLTETNEIRFVNRVAQKVIQREFIDQSGGGDEMGVGEFLMDIRRLDQVWLRRGRSLVHISSSQEDRDVWKYTLQKCISISPINPRSTGNASEEKTQEALFEHARSLCTNNAQKAVINAIRSEFHLSHGRAELAAKYLAQCPASLKPFADTAIRLALPKLGIEGGPSADNKGLASLQLSNSPLIAYLSEKMRASRMKEDTMTSTMIGAWLTELILHERENNNTPENSALLAQFLNSNIDTMDAKTVLKILASHDVNAGECASFAAKSGDLATAVNAALNTINKSANGAISALQILNDSPFELAEPFYYKHAMLFLSMAPGQACDSFLLKYPMGLSPLRLLPSMMNYERTRTERARLRRAVEATQGKGSAGHGGVEESKASLDIQVAGPTASVEGIELKLDNQIDHAVSFVDDSSVLLRYCQGVIVQGCRENAIYSYLISLYAKLEDEEPLLAFLSSHIPAAASLVASSKRSLLAGDSVNSSIDDAGPLDMSFALRTVLGTGRHFRSAIKLYMGFGMRQQAVELALKVDPTLARELAQDSVELEERKRLWLMIARNAAAEGSSGGRDVVSRVVAVLKDCGPDVLSIEDVLPFLPDFTRIDEIKDEVCDALTSYSTKIDTLVKAMSECDKACDIYRSEITQLRNYQMRMKIDARCALTNKKVLGAGEPFYVFPSGYVFLATPLKEMVIPYLNEKQRQRVVELDKSLSELSESDKRKESLQRELDGLIAAECPLTGSIMVDSIDKEFDDVEESFDLPAITGSALLDRVDV